MSSNKQVVRVLLLILVGLTASIFLTSCGGGNGSSMTTPPPPPVTNPVPQISTISPTTATAGAATTTVTVNGSGFIQSSTVQWNQASRATTFVSATQLTFAASNTDLANAGTAQVNVVNPTPGGGASSAATFTIDNPAPVISSLSQNSATAGANGATVTITGTGFVQGSTVQWNQSNRTTTYVSATQLQFAATGADVATARTAQITVVNAGPGGGASSASIFTINNPAPVSTALSQTSVTAGANGATLTITGTGFVQGSTVQWNQNSRTTTYVSATQLQFTATAADLATGGTAQVTVMNPAPGGGASAGLTFTINNPAPQVTSLSKTSATINDAGTTLSVNGSGFVSSSAITWNGASRTTTFVSATQLQLRLNAADLQYANTTQIAVSNPAPGGGTSGSVPLAVSYASPTITSLSPASVSAGGPAFNLLVNGTGFVPASTVQFNGAARATAYVNSSQISFPVTPNDIASPGSAQVAVATPSPGGGTSANVTFTISAYPVPTISGTIPPSIVVNSPDTSVTLVGTGFTSFSTVQVNGTNVTVNWWNYQQLNVTIPAADLTAISSLSLTVTNPGPVVSSPATLNVVASPPPVLTSISPAAAAVGEPGFTLTLFGSGFISNSVVKWNGSDLTTTYVSSSELTASVPASDIQGLGNSQITVFNPTPGGGTSSTFTFTTYLPLPNNDLIYNPVTQLLYVSTPSSAGPNLGNSIISVDPYTGNLGTPIFVGSEPGKMALSSDGKKLWVALNGAGAVREVDLTTQTAGLQFGLGGGTGIYNPPNTVQAMAVMPGSPDTIAVAAPNGIGYSSVVTIYDSGVARSKTSTGFSGCCSPPAGLIFDPTGTKLYAFMDGYGVLTLDSTGITGTTSLNASVSSNDLRYDNGRVYLTSGTILDAHTGTQLGVFSVAPGQNANGSVAPDSTIGRAYVLTNPNFNQSYQINAYDLSTFVLDGSLPIGTAYFSYPASPTALTRWGQDGLAFRDGQEIYVLRSTLVRDLSTSLADLSVTASAPTTGATGADIAYNLTISNAGPVTASPAILTDDIPDGSVFKSATPSQGTCTGGSVVRCDLGAINSGSSATVQVVATALSAGSLTNTAMVSAPQGDPSLGNNGATSTTTVTGNTYNVVPAVNFLDPSFVEAGYGPFTLIVSGSGFVSSSTVEWNGSVLPTTFVSDTELTAAVDGSDVASLGWAWVNVVNPSPGGGSSPNLPLTIFQVLSLDTNHLTFDPFTRELYASVPSTATQVTGNSLVAIDPNSGTIGSPMFVGSEPNKLAESSDGQYLYMGLDGSKSLTRVDLTSMTQGATYPLTYMSGSTPTQVAARDIAVMPGNDNTLAIDTGSFSGDGIFDISGSTGTMRANLTGPYTGSNLVFANASTVYSYDSDTSGAEFNRWSVGANGLVKIDQSTLNGIGGFSGSFKLVNGTIYGASGGVANPSTTPPSQIAQFQLYSALGSGQSIEGFGVAPDPSFNRVFFLGETLAGSANPLLMSYDNSTYELLDFVQFTGFPSGSDLIRWGMDGLAWRAYGGNFGTSTPGTGLIMLVRGPFVLPEWSTTNPTPTLTSTTPPSATHATANFYLTVTGSNFVPGAVVSWNTLQRTTTFVDSSHLTVAIPAADIASAGTASLTVTNPGSSASTTLSFTIN